MDFFSILHNIFFVNANEILPGLWLGNVKSAHDKEFLIKNKIEVIINCTRDIPFINDMETIDITTESYTDITEEHVHLPKFTNVRIPVDDSLLEKDILLMQHYLTILLPTFIEYYNQDKKILIHCYAGKQRSAIVIAALLFKIRLDNMESVDKKELSQDVFKFIISKRPQAFTYGLRINFLKTFNRLFNLENEND